jgi:hypothetical protein
VSNERKVTAAVAAVITLVVAWILFAPAVQERYAPEPRAAWVAVQPEGSEIAVAGPVEIESGRPFTLHAVLEARDRDGARVFYTEAARLRIGGEEIPAEALRRWDRVLHPKVLWFTVEGAAPYLKLEPGQDLDRLRFTEFFRPEWPTSWSVPGRLAPRHDDPVARETATDQVPFGTQRFQARIELYRGEDAVLPEERFLSWGAAELPERVESFPAVIASLPGAAAGAASSVFGLTQVELPEDAPPELRDAVSELARRRLAFSRVTVLRRIFAAAGVGLDAVAWRRIEVGGDAPARRWGEEVHPGDLLRAGDRVVVLYLDAGREGALDREDLVLDYSRGSAVLTLSQVFEGGGELEWADLSAASGGS